LLEYASVARIFFGRADSLGLGGANPHALARLDALDQDDDLKEIFDRLLGTGAVETPASECSVAVDVIETGSHIEVVVDLPGVQAADVTVLFARKMLVIVGHKRHGACRHREAAFHLVERTSGRFARAVRVSGPFDAGRAQALMAAGELRVLLPRIEERRGAEIRIPVQVA
jgi:HSP20 family protein